MTMAGHLKLWLLLLAATLASSVSGQFIASINCGASQVLLDLNLITWSTDETLISTGISRVVQPSNSISSVLDTLRVFTTSRKKNCYSIPVTSGIKVLVRASFNYGNYDGMSSPPTFDLHFDGNYWATVETTISGVMRYEITYVTKGDSISVCVAQTKPGQFPFMSALEVRKLDSNFYSEVDKNRALFLRRRESYGASQTLRYPSDDYDRIWRYSVDSTAKTVTNDASFVYTAAAPNKPPSGIFENAMTVTDTSTSLFLGTVTPLDAPIYAIMYFSEVSDLSSLLTRSFMIYESSPPQASRWLSSSITPIYGEVVEHSLYNYTVDATTNVYLYATTDSDLPPLINAMEVFYITDVLTDGTNSKDVKALALLQKTFPVLGGWSGDPCLPAPYSWDWIDCSNDVVPRVTALHLDSFDLSGSLPDISSMDALQIIDLHNNSLTGTIPNFLGTMPNLQQLNLADNKFSGSIPTSLSKNNKLKLTVTGNPSLCTSGKCSSSPGTNSSPGSTTGAKKKKTNMLPLILGIAIPIFLLIWIGIGVFILLRRRKTLSLANANMHVITTGSGANANSDGGANGNPNMVQRSGEEMVNGEGRDNVVQQALVSPSSQLNTSTQNGNLYRQTGVSNP